MPEQQTASRSGLFTTQSAPVPLDGVSIDAEISNFCARVAVSQRYVNREASPIEAVYVFPLDEGAAVCGFEAIIDGTLVVGEVKEREEAFRTYDEAMERGDGGFLLDEERPDVFQASVGNLPPGKEVLLRLTYVTELSVDGAGLRFAIPTTVSPRYAPANDRVGVGRPDSETLNPPVAWRVPYGLNLSIRLAMTGSITHVESPSHPIAVALNGRDATVTLSQRDAALDHDFVLAVVAEGLDAPQAWLERAEDGADAIAIAFAPRLPGTTSPADVIFVVDRSGSMSGTSIGEVRNALQLCLRSMVPGCRFNIVGFGSTHSALFRESRSYNEASLTEASAHVTTLQADLGGTEILPALQFALGQPRHGTLARQVVVLTDGEVTNTDEVLALAGQHAATARIFTFGIGAGASHHLVKGLARAGGGVAEFIYPGERIEPKVVRQFGRLLSPAMTNVRLQWHGLEVTQAPSRIPPIFAGSRLLVYGFLKGKLSTDRRANVRLTADATSGPVTFDVRIDPASMAPGRTVALLAARARIRELEESPEWTSERGSRQSHRKVSRVTQEIVTLSMRYGLISRETSYVAVERRETPVEGAVQLRRVPVALTSGWGGVQHHMIAAGQPFATLATPSASAEFRHARMPSGAAKMPQAMSSGKGLAARATSWARGLRRAPAGPPIRPGTAMPDAPSSHAEELAPTGLQAVIALQRADGTWDLTREFARAIGVDFARLESTIAAASGDRDAVRRAWATALALAWLRSDARDVEDEWRLLAAKASKWLDDVAAVPPSGGTWANAAAALLEKV